MNNKIRIHLASFVVLLITTLTLQAQQAQTMYFMDKVPQSNEMNPAKQFSCKFYLGMPGLNNFGLSLKNTGPTLNDFIYNADAAKVFPVLFLNPTYGDKGAYMDAFGKVNYLSSQLDFNIVSIGFRANRYFISFHVKERIEQNFEYPKTLADITTYGIKDNGEYDFSHMNFDVTHFREYALGISEKIDDRWQFGVRAKFLLGKSTFRTNNNISLNTTLEKWTIPAGFSADLSAPVDVILDSNNSFQDAKEIEGYDYLNDYLLNRSNWGGAIDMGAIFTPNDKFEFSASIVDLGSIGWRSNVTNFQQSGELNFEGIPINLSDSASTDFAESMLDSLQFDITNNSFTTPLSTKMYLSARYFLSPKFSVGALSRTQIYRGRILPQLTLSANLNDKFFSTSFSYSIMNNSYNNFGMGVNFKVGMFNLYLLTDNIPYSISMITPKGETNAVPYPYHYKTASFRIGMNLIMGCKDVNRDKPMIW